MTWLLYHVLVLFVYQWQCIARYKQGNGLCYSIGYMYYQVTSMVLVGGVPLLTNGLRWQGMGYAKLPEGGALMWFKAF